MAENIIDMVKRVADLRGVLKMLTEDKKARFSAWESENALLLNATSVSTLALTDAEAALRTEAIKVYQETGSKTPGPGVGIRILSVLSYEETVATQWAMEHRMALKLDKKSFEQIAKIADIPFVQTSQEIQATIAQDLEAVLRP